MGFRFKMSNIEWQWTMKKPQVPLAQGLHLIAIPLMQKNLKITVDLPIKHINGDIYFGKKEIKEIHKLLKENINKDKNYPYKIKKKIEQTIDTLKITTEEIEKYDMKKQSDNDLLRLFFKSYQVIGELTAFMSFKGTVQMSDILGDKVKEMLANKITDPEERTNIFLLLSIPKQDSFITQEQKNMLKIGYKKQKMSKIEQQLLKHTKLFSWMGCVMFAGKPYTQKYFEKELQEMLKEDCESKLKKLEQQKQKRKQEINDVVERLKLSQQEKELLDSFRDWTYLRTFIKDMTSVGITATISILEEIAKRTKMKHEDLLYLSDKELQEIFTDKKQELVKESKLRQKGWGLVIIQNNAKYYNYLTVKEIEEPEEIVPAGIKGFSAYKGIVKGTAIIVNSIEDLEKVKEDNILITHMTTTNFVPILSKVSAIVTDEGGITCHAAIISRELQIPCIIGTRLATKAFRTGDLLEVDAYKGIVKKIK